MRSRELNNQLKPAVPTVFLYDVGSSQSFPTDGDFHTWDTTKIITSHFQYTDDTDRITLQSNSSGYFKVEFDVSWSMTMAPEVPAMAQAMSAIYKNGELLDGSKVYTNIVWADYEQGSAYANSHHISYIVYLEKGDYLQIKSNAVIIASSDIDEVDMIADTCRLLIQFIPMQGWDNSSGGRTEYKGGVLR